MEWNTYIQRNNRCDLAAKKRFTKKRKNEKRKR